MEQLEVQQWVRQLCAIDRAKFTVPNVLEFLQHHGVQAGTLESFLHWDPCCYTRNLIYKCDLFEVIAICWESGHISRTHNHRGQNCWMVVPIGKLKVQNFRVDVQDAVKHTCRMVPTDTYVMDALHPAAVNPLEPVHQVLNLPAYKQRAVSLHIYSYPYDSCEVYSPEQGTYMDVPLYYTSEYGKLSTAEKLS
jgi:cysteine dioxygenase